MLLGLVVLLRLLSAQRHGETTRSWIRITQLAAGKDAATVVTEIMEVPGLALEPVRLHTEMEYRAKGTMEETVFRVLLTVLTRPLAVVAQALLVVTAPTTQQPALVVQDSQTQ